MSRIRTKAAAIAICTTVLLLITSCNRSEEELSMQPYEGYPMLESREEIKQLLKDKCLDTISFNHGEVIADIGAGNGYVEAMLAMFHDSLTFYIQDIDTAVCNQEAINKVVDFYQGVKGTKFTSRFIVVNGTDSESCLPEIAFDRIFMLWSYQYIKEPGLFIRDLRTRIKDEGILYVINPEQDYEFGKTLKESYGWNGSTIEKQISDIIACGFTLLRVGRNYEDKQQPYIMAFQKTSP